MKLRLAPFLLCASLFLVNACDSDSDSDNNTCDPATFATKCDDNKTKVISCKNGRIFNTICSSNTSCDEAKLTCVPNGGMDSDCVVGWTDCEGTTKRLYCDAGTIQSETCPNDFICSNGQCTPSNQTNTECHDSDMPVCIDALTRKYCHEGHYKLETSNNSSKQCDSKTGTIKTPSIGGYCDPDIFSEHCYNTEAVIWCDAGTVTKTICSDYGDNYKCDIFENYYGKNKDAAGCFSSKDDCTTIDDTLTECRDLNDYDESIPKNTKFATTYYKCVQGFLGLHWTEVKTVDCKNHCKNDSACYEEAESE